jgi:ABC-2 type transport system permease protein
VVGLTRSFVALRWRLLRGSLRGGGSERAGVIVSTIGSAIVGAGVGLGIAVAGRGVTDDDNLFIIFCTVVALGLVGISVVAGVTQPIDPRVLAVEPLSERERAVGLLASAASGPPGLAGVMVGIGLTVGGFRGLQSAVVVVPAVIAWLLTLLLLARTATNVLGLVSNRFPRTGQLVVGIGGLAFYGAFQLVPGLLVGLDDEGRERAARFGAFNPVGQLGRAIGTADQSLAAATGHLLIGVAFLPLLTVVFVRTTTRLATSTRRHGGPVAAASTERPLRRLVRRLCGSGGVGAVAWRSILTRFRTARTALETFTGAGVGLAAVLVPTLVRDGIGSGAVLVGGAVQLAVLFMAGNSFGSDGPALTNELLAGAGPSVLAGGKARSIVIVAGPLALVGPLLAAWVTGEWQYLPAGILVGFGALLAGTGGAIVQSTFVPVAIPESDNPFASGESGRGLVAALLLAAVLFALAVVTLPVALALIWANSVGSEVLVTLFGALTLATGWAVMRGGVRLSVHHLTTRGPEFVAAITPSR